MHRGCSAAARANPMRARGLQEHWAAGRRACSALTALLQRLPADTATPVLAGLLRPCMRERLSAPDALQLPFLARMRAAPRELRRAPSGGLEAVLSAHSARSLARSGSPLPPRASTGLGSPRSGADGEAGASSGSLTDRVDRDSAMGSQPAGLGAGRAAALAAAMKARLGRGGRAAAPPPPLPGRCQPAAGEAQLDNRVPAPAMHRVRTIATRLQPDAPSGRCYCAFGRRCGIVLSAYRAP